MYCGERLIEVYGWWLGEWLANDLGHRRHQVPIFYVRDRRLQ